MKDWHEKPPPEVRSVRDALHSAEQRRRDLPLVVQVRAYDWDEVILADEVKRLTDLLKGNYILDSPHPWGSRFRRQAGFLTWGILFFFVSVIFGIEVPARNLAVFVEVLNHVSKTESQRVGVFKNIFIRNTTPYIDPFLPRGQVLKVAVLGQFDEFAPNRPGHGRSEWLSMWNGVRLGKWPIVTEFARFSSNRWNDFVRGRVSKILDFNERSRDAVWEQIKFCVSDTQISSQLSSSFIPTIREQEASKSANDNCKKRDNRSVVLVNPRPEAPTVDEIENGTTFLRGLLGIGVILLAYTILKKL